MATRTRNQVIAFRVTPAERRQISAKINRSGLSQQKYLLDAALNHPIYVMEELKPILSELCAWGKNLNQLTALGPIRGECRLSICRSLPRPWEGPMRRSAH